MDGKVCDRCGRVNRVEARFSAACGNTLPDRPAGAGPAPVSETLPDNPVIPPTQIYSENYGTAESYPPPTPTPAYGYPPDNHPPAASAYPSSGWQQPAPTPGSPFGTAIALVAVILFVIIQLVALPIFYFGLQSLNPSVYKNALKKQDFYNRAPDLIAEQLEFQKYTGKNLFCVPLDKTDWSQITKRLLAPAYLQSTSESLIDQFFTQVKSSAAKLNLAISLGPVNQALGGGPGFDAYQQVFQNKSVCSQEDLNKVYAYLLREPNSCIPRCKLPPDLLDRPDLPLEIQTMALLWDNVDEAVSFLMEVASEFLPDQQVININATGAIGVLRLINISFWAALVIALFSFGLLLLVFLNRKARSIPGVLAWWGWPILVVGIGCLLIAVVTYFGGLSALSGTVSDPANQLAPGITQAIKDFGRSVMLAMVVPLGLHGLLAAGLGALMVAAGIVLTKLRG